MLFRVLTIGLLFISPVEAASKRDPAVRAEFQRQNPCPSTGKTSGKCFGWEADHKDAICAGGADAVWNLQWLTKEAHRAKTRHDIAFCAILRRTKVPD